MSMKLAARRFPIPFMFVLLVACGPDEPVEPTPTPTTTTGQLKVIVRPTWNGAPFVMNTVYHNVSDYRVKVEGLKFYLGDVRLVNGSSSSVVKDVEFFDLAHNGDTVLWTGVPTGTWNGMQLGFGVPQTLNDADPIVYPPGHPLDLARGTYWTWATAYRFLQFDGRYDLNGASTGAPASPFSMHTGLNACYQQFDLALNGEVTITAGNTSTIVLDLAVDGFFHTDSDTLDLATENQTHGTDLPLAQKLTNNAVHSFSAE
ncbi:MAG: hypothetical protein JNM62_05545 [Flavobacteriales bacterium]|nr:hypothetical protein [Flavobacteriales bacterium]